MTTNWRSALLEQLDFYWTVHLWPRLQGLTDDEYFWEPARGCWSVRPAEDGTYRLEQFSPEPPTPPVTTIAWRMVHVGRDIFGKRARAFFGPTQAPADADMYDNRHWPEPLPATADAAVIMLEQAYRHWRSGVESLDDEALLRPLGPKGAEFADDSMAALVLHLNREAIAHGAEICLLRDLYRSYREREDPVVDAVLAGDADALSGRLEQDAERGKADGTGRPDLVAEAAGRRHWPVVRTLVRAGFDPSAGSPAALHFAAAAGEAEEVRFLVEHGADVTAADARFGLPPSEWADYFGHAGVAGYLRDLSS